MNELEGFEPQDDTCFANLTREGMSIKCFVAWLLVFFGAIFATIGITICAYLIDDKNVYELVIALIVVAVVGDVLFFIYVFTPLRCRREK